jgi:hypothetical protein
MAKTDIESRELKRADARLTHCRNPRLCRSGALRSNPLCKGWSGAPGQIRTADVLLEPHNYAGFARLKAKLKPVLVAASEDSGNAWNRIRQMSGNPM